MPKPLTVWITTNWKILQKMGIPDHLICLLSEECWEKYLLLLYWLCQSLWLCQRVQSLSCVRLFATPWTAACQASLSNTNSRSLLKLMSIESVMTFNHLILFSPSPGFNLSQHQGLFQWVRSLHQVAKGLELQLQHQSFQWWKRSVFIPIAKTV